MPNPWLPRWGDPAVRLDRGWKYPTEAELLAAKTQPTLKGTMKKQNYYPTRITDQIPWLLNWILKIASYETKLGLPPAHVDASVASANFLVYVLSQWLTAVRAFGPDATAAMDLLTSGSGPDPVALPVFTAPPLPAGVASVPPGVLNRLFDMVALVKASPGYDDIIGKDLLIVESAVTTNTAAVDHSSPQVKIDVVQGAHGKSAKATFIKHGHAGVYGESKRGTTDFEFLAIDTNSPYLDERPLLVAGVPEVRQYRFRFWDKGTPNGDWCAIITVTVGP